jgi:hypothetical protein
MARIGTLIGALVLWGIMATPAQAAPIFGGTLFATGGDVTVTFLSQGAGYINELYLDGPTGDSLGVLFSTLTTPAGSTFNLGGFLPGTELVFRLLVRDTGHAFFTGTGQRNPDGIAHAMVDAAAGRTDGALVGFEDVFGGGDGDYNDLVFSFSSVGVADIDPAAVDEPAALLLFGAGLAAFGLVARRATLRR